MNDETQDQSPASPSNVRFIYINRFSTKCIVSTGLPVVKPFMKDTGPSAGAKMDKPWFEVGGLAEEITERMSKGFVSWRGEVVDTKQARIYYRQLEGAAPECEVVLPDDLPFRASRKGHSTEDESASFDENGNPAPEVKLLYALKTGLPDHAQKAVHAFLLRNSDQITEIEMGERMRIYLEAGEDLKTLVANLLLGAASQSGKLADWARWDHVAQGAADYTADQFARKQQGRPNNHDLFVQAVNEVTTKFHGVPTQNDVRKRWIELGGIGTWEEIRKTLGFDWIPPERDHKKSWERFSSITRERSGSTAPRVVSLEGMNDLEAFDNDIADEEIPGIWIA
jgi:hypothetical protein